MKPNNKTLESKEEKSNTEPKEEEVVPEPEKKIVPEPEVEELSLNLKIKKILSLNLKMNLKIKKR